MSTAAACRGWTRAEQCGHWSPEGGEEGEGRRGRGGGGGETEGGEWEGMGEEG